MKNKFLPVLLMFATGSLAGVEIGKPFLQASVALDRALYPALLATDGGSLGEAGAAVARLKESWQSYASGQTEILSQAAGWSMTRAGVTRRIEMAEKFVVTDDVRMAHVLLMQVREDLVRVRVALDAETFLDRLVLFKVTMESTLGEGSLAEVDQKVLAKGISALLARWFEVEETEIDNDVYDFLWSDASALSELLEAEGDAIRKLRNAAMTGSSDDLDHLADVVRKGFSEITLFLSSS
ncbi:MAG: hypothetical protein DRP71_11520 [Verrucomicrobia bacterium]|nr:MAG: hypothetical protein DRP71_11520 [Verrucomicrobiota bacterium]